MLPQHFQSFTRLSLLPVLLATLLALLGTLVPFSEIASADAPDLAHRPMTQVQMILNMVEMIKRYPHIIQSQPLTMQKLRAVGAPGAEPSYNRGADVGEILSNSVHDIVTILGNFFPCWNWKIIGFCIKPEFPIPKFCPYVEYRLPKQKVDNHFQDLQSHYLPSVANKLILKANEAIFYPMVQQIANTNIMQAHASLRMQGALGLPSVTDIPRFNASASSVSQIENLDQEKRWRGARDSQSGWTKNEYTVLPELFSNVLDHIPWADCHKKKRGNIWSSDYPLMILPARWELISYMIAPLEMINRFINPQTCTGINTWMRQGRSPIDLLFTGSTTRDALQLTWPGHGCQGTNAGPWVPVLNGAHTALSSNAAAIGIQKGMVTARHFRPQNFYPFNSGRDRIQYTRNRRMPNDCRRLEQYAPGWGSGNYLDDKEDPWYVAEVWRYFRCCTAGNGYIPVAPPIREIEE
ncbi:MAG: hypothetical protein K1X79_13670 [Oligoflexia bacterium]|nr:hypothetical protein [Oligoflexia bacterium]